MEFIVTNFSDKDFGKGEGVSFQLGTKLASVRVPSTEVAPNDTLAFTWS